MYLKIALTLFSATIVSILVFAVLYMAYNGEHDFMSALFQSAMIQTLVDIPSKPTSNLTKLFIITQGIISYLITAHIVIISVHYLKTRV